MAQVASSYVRTAGAAATREGEFLTAVFNSRPQAVTIYVRLAELGTAKNAIAAVAPVVAIGDVNGTPLLRLFSFNGGGAYRFQHSNGLNSAEADLGVGPNYYDTVELLAQLNANGSVTLVQSINGGAPTTVTLATPLVFAAAWFAKSITVGGANGGAFSALGLRNLVISRGVMSLQQMQKMARVI